MMAKTSKQGGYYDRRSEPSETNDVSGLLTRTIKSVTEGITGIASSDRRDVILSFGHILQRLRGGKFLSTLKTEWDRYKAKGRISDEFEQSDDNLDCLQELLDFVDRDVPDTRRLKAMKNLYLNIAVNSPSSSMAINQQQRLLVSLTNGMNSIPKMQVN